MAYRNDFYSMNNIIGYTGDIRGLPTVYFQRGHTFGHITQAHTLPDNVGREQVRSHPNYHIDNYYRRGRLVAVEWIGSRDAHTSRNTLIWRRHFNPGDLLTLGVAIYRFQEIKLRYDPVGRAQVRNKRAMHQELRSLFRDAKNPRIARNIDSEPMAAHVIENAYERTWV